MVGVNGVFGERMCDVAARCGAEVVRVEADWGTPLDPQRLLDAHPTPAVIAVVHAETSTGVRNDLLAATAGARLPQLTSVRVPEHRLPPAMGEADVRRTLLDDYGVEIGGGLGPWAGKCWRIGSMGHAARHRNVTLILAALDELLDQRLFSRSILPRGRARFYSRYRYT